MTATNGTANGHAPRFAQDAPPAKPKAAAGLVLSVRRVEPGQILIVRTLSEHYGGLFTHYRGVSRYCPGASDCNPAYHRLGRVWKGYAAAEEWLGGKIWKPCVLEITEACELDMRGVWQRGQVWELYTEVQTGKKWPRVVGKLHPEQDWAALPPAFDIRPPLLHLYHVDAISLSAQNPLPPRVIVGESTDAPPEHLRLRLEEREAQQRAYDERAKAAAERRKAPSEKKA